MNNLKIKDCKILNYGACEKSDSIKDASKLLKKFHYRCLVVLENQVPIGILSTSDIVIKVIAEDKNIETTKAEEVMSTPAFILREDLEIQKGLIAIFKKGLNYCPVIDKNDKFIGVITLQELIRKNSDKR